MTGKTAGLASAWFLGLCWVTCISVFGATPASAQSCDETCLRRTMDTYLDALVAHDPKRLAVTDNLRFTENAVPIALGQGLWATASGPVRYKIYVADPQMQSVAFMGNLLENGRTDYLGVRLKLKGGKIAEIESEVGRGKFVNRTATTARASLSELTPRADRLPRDRLIEISGKYFDAVTESDGTLAPFGPLCQRVENGVQTTNVALTPHSVAEDCQTNVTNLAPISRIVDRRVVAVDESRNLVMWAASFEMPGVLTLKIRAWMERAKLRGGPQMDPPAPSSGPLLELFRIRNGKIAEIEAVFDDNLNPFGLNTGWGGGGDGDVRPKLGRP